MQATTVPPPEKRRRGDALLMPERKRNHPGSGESNQSGIRNRGHKRLPRRFGRREIHTFRLLPSSMRESSKKGTESGPERGRITYSAYRKKIPKRRLTTRRHRNY